MCEIAAVKTALRKAFKQEKIPFRDWSLGTMIDLDEEWSVYVYSSKQLNKELSIYAAEDGNGQLLLEYHFYDAAFTYSEAVSFPTIRAALNDSANGRGYFRYYVQWWRRDKKSCLDYTFRVERMLRETEEKSHAGRCF